MQTAELSATDHMRRFWNARGKEDPVTFSLPFGGSQLPDFDLLQSGQQLVDFLEVRAGLVVEGKSRILDVGCGVGRSLPALASIFDQVVGVDISSTMLAAAGEWLPSNDKISLIEAAVETGIPVQDDYFSAAIAIGIFQHFPESDLVGEALKQITGKLQPGGTLIFDLRIGQNDFRLPGDGGLPERVLAHPVWQGTRVQLDHLAALALEAGLEIESILGPETPRALVTAHRA